MLRKFTNDQLYPLFNYYTNNGKSISKTAKKFKISYNDAYYRIREYERRLNNGEDRVAQDTNGNKIRVAGLAPFMIRFNSVDDAWEKMRKEFTHDQLTIITKFYNTVIYQADCIGTDKVNVITENV